MLPPDVLALLREWWRERSAWDAVAPEGGAAGQLGPSSMSLPCLSGQRQAAAARLHRREAGSPAHRHVFVEVADWRIAAGLDLPAAFQLAVALDPMTSQRQGWNPALALRAAKTRKVVIGIADVGKPNLVQPKRDALRLNRPEFCKSGFCERFEHRSPPLPRFARQAGERDDQLGATATPHAAKARAIDLDILRQR
jgi:hypothetical protein